MSVDMVELEVFILADDGAEESGPGLGCTSPEHKSRIHSQVRDTRQAKCCMLFFTNLKLLTIALPGEMIIWCPLVLICLVSLLFSMISYNTEWL